MLKPVVSVCMITYGHEKFIRQAIHGVLIQECDFDIELILVNDCSFDKTDEVIEKILESHPRSHLINYIKHDENIGMISNFVFALQQCKSTYIALCDGDDYWTDPLKLQKQVEFLEANPEYVLCFHQVDILKTDGTIVDDFITVVPENYETIETLARLGNYIHTPSVVFKNVIEKYPFEFELSPIGDYFLYMLLAEHGKLKHLEEKMAVYRQGVGIISKMCILDITINNIKMYSCMLSCIKNKNVEEVIIAKQIDVLRKHYMSIELEFKNGLTLRNLVSIEIKIVINFYRKIRSKLLKILL